MELVNLEKKSSKLAEILRVMINYQEVELELVSKCKEAELLYKYMITIRNLNEAHSLTVIKSDRPIDLQKKTSFESILHFDLVMNVMNYEIDVFIQTPFDSRPFHIGAYLLNSQIIQNEMRSGLRNVPISPNPYIFAHYWCEYISSTFVYVSIFKESHNDDQDEPLFDSFYYVLTDLSMSFFA
jgi:hypothetical protein